MVEKHVTGAMLKKMFIAGSALLSENKQLVDSLNVFPVPDGDTGTNMSLTALAASREVENISDDSEISVVAKLASSGALRGARGNSGVILSQLYRGFSKSLEGKATASVDDIAAALRRASETAYKAVMKPREGTMLTVARAAAEKAEELANETDNVQKLLKAVIIHMNSTLNKTKDMLKELKQANVVDSGGMGLLFLLEGAYKAVFLPLDGKTLHSLNTHTSARPATDFSALSTIDTSSITFGYCTEFFIKFETDVSEIDSGIEPELKDYLSGIGDSIVVVADDDVIKVHVHTDHPGKVLEKALRLGLLSNIKIENMREQHTSRIDFNGSEAAQSTPEQEPTAEQKELGFVTVSVGDGFKELFSSLGVDEVIEGGQTMNPSTEDILNAIKKVNANNIIILPNNKNIILAAQQAIFLVEDKKLYVVPSKSVPQGISAMEAFQMQRDVDWNVTAMTEALKKIKTGAVTYAVRDTSYSGMDIAEGDILGLIDDKIEVVGKDINETTIQLVEKMIDNESYLLSVYYGKDIEQSYASVLQERITGLHSNMDIELQQGAQILYYYILSVE